MTDREKFEEFYEQFPMDTDWSRRCKWDHDDYAATYTQTAWLVWQESRRLAVPPSRARTRLPKDIS